MKEEVFIDNGIKYRYTNKELEMLVDDGVLPPYWSKCNLQITHCKRCKVNTQRNVIEKVLKIDCVFCYCHTPMQETKQKEIRDWEEKLLDITSMVSFCPHCLMYGTPLGLRDKICGNCGKNGLRNYIKLSSVQSFISTLLAERDAEVLKKMDEYEYHKDEVHCTCLGALREFITNKLDGK